MKIYQLDASELTLFANQVKEGLARDCKLPQLNDYLITVNERRWFGKLLGWFDSNAKQDELTCIVSRKLSDA